MQPTAFVRAALNGFFAGLAASAAWITASGGACAPAVAWALVSVVFAVLCVKAVLR